MSPAMKLVMLIWTYGQEKGGRSYLRLNQSLYDAVALAIKSGLRFAPDDFTVFSEKLRFGYWGGNSVGKRCGDSLYTQAVHGKDRGTNISACISFEKYANRKPWILASGERIAVGTGLRNWAHKGKVYQANVTSIDDAADAFVFTAWEPKRAVLRVSREQFADAQKAVRNSKKALKKEATEALAKKAA